MFNGTLHVLTIFSLRHALRFDRLPLELKIRHFILQRKLLLLLHEKFLFRRDLRISCDFNTVVSSLPTDLVNTVVAYWLNRFDRHRAFRALKLSFKQPRIQTTLGPIVYEAMLNFPYV
jgi:hypothetical protein